MNRRHFLIPGMIVFLPGFAVAQTTPSPNKPHPKRSASASPVPTPSPAPGSATGLITWQFNNYVGTRGDAGASVLLLPSPMPKRITLEDADAVRLGMHFNSLSSQLQSTYGIYAAQADGSGNVYLDAVQPGSYFALIVSKQTYRDFHLALSDLEMRILSSFVADTDALNQFVGNLQNRPTELLLQKWTVESITVRSGGTTHFSYDFGNTYI